jgi:pimeloyl-ACP methyl ester carboxylesterase
MRVCLIHGSTQSLHGWDLLVHELMAWKVGVTAVDLPTDKPKEGAEFFANEVVRQVPDGEAPVVVAHSAAGLILPVVAARIKVSKLIYLSAIIPTPRERFLDQVQQAPAMFQPGWVGTDPTKDPALARTFLFHDCDEKTFRWALTTVRLWSAPGVMREVCPLGSMPKVPTAYISATQDRTINPEYWERAAGERLGVKPIRIDAGHAPYVSRPRDIAKIIMSA